MYFDIGSNIGSWALSNQKNDLKIIAIEASPNTFNILLERCKNNNNIICLNYAVCINDNLNNEIIFYDCVSANTISTLNKDWLSSEKSRFFNNKYNEIIVKTISIDELIQKYGIPELIKIDVEGGEYDCVRSLTTKTPCLCFEWASETQDITYKCLDYLVSLGYSSFYLQLEDNYIFRPNDYNDTINTIKNKLSKMTPKKEWGMIWCI